MSLLGRSVNLLTGAVRRALQEDIGSLSSAERTLLEAELQRATVGRAAPDSQLIQAELQRIKAERSGLQGKRPGADVSGESVSPLKPIKRTL